MTQDSPFSLFTAVPLSRDPLTFRVPRELMSITAGLRDAATGLAVEVQDATRAQMETYFAMAIERGPEWCVAMSDVQTESMSFVRKYALVRQPISVEYRDWMIFAQKGAGE